VLSYNNFTVGREDILLEFNSLRRLAGDTLLLMRERVPQGAHRRWGEVTDANRRWGIEHLETLLEENGVPAFRAEEGWVAAGMLAYAWKSLNRRVSLSSGFLYIDEKMLTDIIYSTL
jgi:hypothetical protein